MGEAGGPTLASLRAEGADRLDPARFHYLEALSRRLPGQPAPVQRVLAARLQQAVADYAARAHAGAKVANRPSEEPGGRQAASPAARVALESPLARLNRDLATRARAEEDSARTDDGASLSGLKSVRQFGEVWSRISAEQQVLQAQHRGPENAGPLNSHKLMVRSLSLMRSLSPDYLRRFLAQMDALLWLEQANARPARVPAKSARTPRAKP
jgi:hypothetical protein